MTNLHQQDGASSPRLFYSTISVHDRPAIYRRDGKIHRVQVGERLGPYTLIDSFVRLDKGWGCLIRCQCGKERKIYFRELRGLAMVTPRKCDCTSPWLIVWSRFKSGCSIRDIEVDLNFSQFKFLVSLPCVYCSANPSNRYKLRNKGKDGFLFYSGIDRIDSSKKYEVGNILPCCKRCNRAKSTDSLTEFVEWINQLGASVRVESILAFGRDLDARLGEIQ
jgi:hypothetical protein